MHNEIKAQHIEPSTRIRTDVLSVATSLDSKSKESMAKRGRLFVVASIKSNRGPELTAATNLFLDTLREEYFKENLNTPLHAIEKALIKAQQDFTSFWEDSNNTPQISYCTALIWNKVLYISHIGNPAAYLIRNGGVKDLAPNSSPNEIITMSSLLSHEDVIIIGTNEFKTSFPPQEIINNLGGLSSSINRLTQREAISAVLIKLAPEKAGRKKDPIQNTFKNVKIAGIVTSSLSKIKESIFSKTPLSESYKKYQIKKTAPIASISKASTIVGVNGTDSLSPISGNRKRLSSRKTKGKNALITGIGSLLVLMTLSYILVSKNFDGSNTSIISPILESKGHTTNQEKVLGDSSGQAILNLSNVSKDFDAIDVQLLTDNEIIILDKTSKKLYSIDIKTKDYKELVNDLINPRHLSCENELCFFIDENIIKVIKPSKKDESGNSYTNDLKDVTDISGYGSYLYLLADTSVYSLELGNKNAQPKAWLKNDITLTKPMSLSVINNNVYVLEDRSVYKYSGGNKTSYKLSDNSHLLSPTILRANIENLFILNSAQKSVAIYDNATGSFIKKVKLSDSTNDKVLIVPKKTKTGFYYIIDDKLYVSE